MGASDRFAAWLRGKITRKIPRETPQEPSVGSQTPQEAPTLKKPLQTLEGAISVYHCGNIVHVVFDTRSIWVTKKKQENVNKQKEKDFINLKDPITRSIKRISKKELGSISRVYYYDDKGRLIE